MEGKMIALPPGRYIGTKVVENLGFQERDGAPGYRILYPDGYESWSPTLAFRAAYRRTDNMSFGLALEAVKMGKKVARAGWNGKGMWISYSPGSTNLPAANFWNPNNRAFAEANGGTADVLPCITFKTADGKILMGWLASQTDMLADDWVIVD